MPKEKYSPKRSATKIQQWQAASGLAGYEVAQEVGISAPYYSNIRAGKQSASVEVLTRIASVLGGRVSELTGTAPAGKNGGYDQERAALLIQEWQVEARLTGKEIAERVGISQPYYTDIRRGKQRGSIDVLARIVEVLGHRLDELLQREARPVARSIERSVDKKALQKAIRPILKRQARDFMACYELWSQAPENLKKALLALQGNAGRRAR